MGCVGRLVTGVGELGGCVFKAGIGVRREEGMWVGRGHDWVGWGSLEWGGVATRGHLRRTCGHDPSGWGRWGPRPARHACCPSHP